MAGANERLVLCSHIAEAWLEEEAAGTPGLSRSEARAAGRGSGPRQKTGAESGRALSVEVEEALGAEQIAAVARCGWRRSGLEARGSDGEGTGGHRRRELR